ncbi:MAG: sigma-70 family RNA polymerase sigma factor [Verrucomicrobia bacterium]|nr:sigma-70 family RNA polymerase sigma factor [Verrucomicrobiota bacterium]
MLTDEQSDRMEWVQSALNRYEGPLTRYAARITGDLDLARDVVQDTFVRLCRENDSKVRDKLGEWLFTVCRNRALDVRRKERRMQVISETDIENRPSQDVSPSVEVERQEASNDVLRLLEALPANQQEVVRLKFQNGLSYKEISRVTNLTVTNVGFLIHTALKTLRQRFKAETKLVPEGGLP